ncbi:MAG: tail assembly protein [Bdellovibrionales bacterium]
MHVLKSPPVKTIRLFGSLGKKFGDVHRFSVRTPAEAVRALCANFPGFEQELLESSRKNVGYKVTVDNREIDESELKFPSSKEIHFAPVIMGAGSGTGKVIIGAVLIVAGLVIGVGSAGTAGFIAGAMVNVGIGLMIGGVVQMLSPVPKADDPQEDPAHKPSYVFNGPVNTIAQGQPVPVGYGRLIVGGAVISAGVVVDDLSTVDPLVDPTPPVWVK